MRRKMAILSYTVM